MVFQAGIQAGTLADLNDHDDGHSLEKIGLKKFAYVQFTRLSNDNDDDVSISISSLCEAKRLHTRLKLGGMMISPKDFPSQVHGELIAVYTGSGIEKHIWLRCIQVNRLSSLAPAIKEQLNLRLTSQGRVW